MTRWADYAEDLRPTAEEETHSDGREWMDATEDGVSVTEGVDGGYTIHAAWLGEDGEKVHGAEAAEARTAEVRETGDTKGIDYTHIAGGWYLITGPGIPEGLKVKGKDAVKEKVKELREAATTEPVIEPLEGHDALVLITEDDDDFVVSAPWLDAPERFADVAAAEARQAALREAGPPEGWEPSAEDTTRE
jgi:hypothetical protein